MPGAPTSPKMWEIFARSDNEIYVTCDGGVVHYYNGSSWTTWATGLGVHLKAVWASSPNDIFVGGWNGRIAHYDGAAWTETPTGATSVQYIEGITGTAPDNVWAVGRYGLVLHWDGAQWSQVSVPSGEIFDDLWATPTGEVFVAGTGGALLWFDGEAWSVMRSPTTDRLFGIHGSSRNQMTAVSTTGVILQFNGSLPGGEDGLIDSCILESPPAASTPASTPTQPLYGRVYVADITPGTWKGAGVMADVGYGNIGTDPRTDLSWRWSRATYNLSAGNDDEYVGTLAPDLAGTYDFAYRFSRDGGVSWLYCDMDGASNAGEYSSAQAGALTVTP